MRCLESTFDGTEILRSYPFWGKQHQRGGPGIWRGAQIAGENNIITIRNDQENFQIHAKPHRCCAKPATLLATVFHWSIPHPPDGEDEYVDHITGSSGS